MRLIDFVNLPVWFSLLLAVVLPTAAFYTLAGWIQRRTDKGADLFRGEGARTVNGYLVSVVGILLGLILVNALNDTKRAEATVAEEAQTLAAISRLLRPFPEDDQRRIRPLLGEYLDAVVRKEWPALRRGNSESQSSAAAERLYAGILSVRDIKGPQVQAYAQLLGLATRTSDLRRERERLARGSMPEAIWLLMLFVSALTLGVMCVNTSREARGHAVLVAAYTLILCSIVYVVAVLQYPFSGPIHADPAPLESMRAVAARFPTRV